MSRADRGRRRLHRLLGSVGAGLITWLALTGLVLNHSADLALHERTVPAWLAGRLYPAGVPDDLSGYPLGEHWATVLEGKLYFAGRPVDTCAGLRGGLSGELRGELRGGLHQGDFAVVACDDAVHVLDAAGNRLDRLDASWGIAGTITGVSLRGDSAGPVVIHATEGTWCLDPQEGSLSACEAMPAAAISAQPLPAAARQQLAAALSGPGVNWERLLHDLHTGRLFGASARWAWDLFGLALLALAASGVVMIRRGKRRGG